MASRTRRSRRFLLPLVLGAVLAGEITGIALAHTLPPVIVPLAAPQHAPAATDAPLRATPTTAAARVSVERTAQAPAPNRGRLAAQQASSAPARPATASRATARASGHPAAAAFHGTNHVWIPSLGISKGIQSFPCSRARPPDAGVYRWGCAGRNNVYLLSHAWSTFKPLHDAYVRGSLRKGMRVWYGDGNGRVHEYRVIWWRVTAPTTAASWAWAPLTAPGMTLQTCVGAHSEYRLMVRLDRVD